MQDNLPKKNPKTEKFDVRITQETKKRLTKLSEEKNVDVPEWVRGLIDKGLDELKIN